MTIDRLEALPIPKAELSSVRRLHVSEDKGSGYLSDESKLRGESSDVFLPHDESELAAILEFVHLSGTHATISGMRTGVVGGAVPDGGVVISMEDFQGRPALGHDEIGFYVRVPPNMTLRELNLILSRRSLPGLSESEPGVKEAIATKGRLFYPVDPTEQGGSLGGNVACNSSGARSYKYGPTRDWVRRLRVMLHDGSVLDITRGDHMFKEREGTILTPSGPIELTLPSYDFRMGIKNSAGIFVEDDMDPIDLFIGSEGIFGIITEIELRLVAWHPLISIIMFFPDDGSALGFVSDLKANKDVEAEFIEYLDGGALRLIESVSASRPGYLRLPSFPEGSGSAVFFDIPFSEESIEEAFSTLGRMAEMYDGSLQDSWCAKDRSGREALHELRHSIPETVFQHVASLKGSNPDIHKMGTDVSVPDEQFPEMMDFYASTLKGLGLEWVVFGHVGDNHPHVEIILHGMDDFHKAREACHAFAAKAIELGGSPSAEHGIGKLKREYLRMLYGEGGLAEIIALKEAIDPQGVFGRGNMTEWST